MPLGDDSDVTTEYSLGLPSGPQTQRPAMIRRNVVFADVGIRGKDCSGDGWRRTATCVLSG